MRVVRTEAAASNLELVVNLPPGLGLAWGDPQLAGHLEAKDCVDILGILWYYVIDSLDRDVLRKGILKQ